MKCTSYTHIWSAKCPVMLTLQLDIVLRGFLEISCRIPSMTITVMNWTKVSFYPRSYYTNWSIKQRMAGSVWLWFLFLCRVSWGQRRSETPQFVTTMMDIRGLHPTKGHCYLQFSEPAQLHSKWQIELIIWLLPSSVHIRCWRMDLCRRQPIWLQHVGCLAHNNAQMTMWEHHMMIQEISRPKTLNSGNPWINFIHYHHHHHHHHHHRHQGIVTRLRSHHFQALPSSTPRPH